MIAGGSGDHDHAIGLELHPGHIRVTAEGRLGQAAIAPPIIAAAIGIETKYHERGPKVGIIPAHQDFAIRLNGHARRFSRRPDVIDKDLAADAKTLV